MKYFNLVMAFVFLMNVNAFAQWNPNTDENTLVVNYTDAGGMDVQSIGTSDGKTYIVYWKNAMTYELWMQVLDADGNQELGPNGILVSNTIPMSTYTSMWSLSIDNDDHVYIGVTGTGDAGGYAFKLDTEGNHLWPSNGISLGGGYLVTILPLEDGNSVISWLSGSYSATMQKFDMDGNAIWANNIVISSDASAPANLFEQSNGYFTVVYHLLGSGISSNLYAQRFNTDGEAQWGNAVQISNTTTQYNSNYYATQDEDIIYYSYFGSIGNRFDSYVQRINTDGSLPWGTNGSDFNVNQNEYEKNTRVAYEEGSDYVWAICSFSDVNQNEYGEYVQKFNKEDGSRLFTDFGKVVYPIGSDNVHADALYLVEDQPVFIIEKGMDNGVSPTTLDIVSLDANGDFVWPEESRPMATYAANKNRVSSTQPVNGQSVVVFAEDRGLGFKIYAQNYAEEQPLNDENEIISFQVPNQIVETEIDNENSTVAVIMAYGTDLSQLIPSIIISENATIDPASGVVQDFTIPVVYTVTAENGDERAWEVMVDITTGTSNINQSKPSIYPNPSNGFITVENNSDQKLNSIMISDVSGKIVYELSTREINNRTYINLLNQKSGIYLIRLEYQHEVFIEKIILQ